MEVEMRSRQDIERDLAAARSRLTAAQAGDQTNRTAYIAACQAATREVQRFEQELANLRPDPLAGLVPPPVRPVATPPPADPAVTGAPAATPGTPAVAARRPGDMDFQLQSLDQPLRLRQVARDPMWDRAKTIGFVVAAVLVFVVFGTLMYIWGASNRSMQSSAVVSQSAPSGQLQPVHQSTPTRTTTNRHQSSVVQPPTSQPTYRDCMFSYGERRELADGRCDHLQ